MRHAVGSATDERYKVLPTRAAFGAFFTNEPKRRR
jgi:hypothetical protein